jgi:hypothetical protein
LYAVELPALRFLGCRTVFWMTGSRMRTPAVLTLIGFLALTARADAAFVPALGSPFPTTAPLHALAVADADRNGTLDVAAGALSLRRGDGTGRLGGALAISTTGTLDGLVTGDFNGDGSPDYAAIEQGAPGDPDRALLFTAQPGAAYLQSEASEDVGEASSLAAGDIDRDGDLDLVVARADAGAEVTVLSNLGGALFSDEDHSVDTGPAESLALADFNGDGWPDVVVGSAEAEVSVLLNALGGGFIERPASATGGSEPVDDLAVADFDGDGPRDLAATSGAGVILLRGDGGGGLTPFGPPRPSGAPGGAVSLAVGDVNADGRTDLAAGGAMGSRVAVLLGDGRGSLVPTLGSPLATGGPLDGEVGALALADMNRDGQTDLVAANGPGSVSVLLNADTGLMEPNPRSVGFGAMPALSALRAHTVTLRSLRGRLRISRVALDAGSRAFSVGPGSCLGRVLLVGQSCAITVRFKAPRRAERMEAVVSVDANAAAVILPLTATVRPPVLSGLRLRPKVLRLQRPGKPVRKGRSTSMRLRYRLSESARMRVRVERLKPGRRTSDKRCVPPRRSNRKARRCKLWEVVQTTTRSRPAGPNSTRFDPSAPARRLAAGSYRLSLSAVDRFRNRSREQRIAFRVKAPRSGAAAQAARPK